MASWRRFLPSLATLEASARRELPARVRDLISNQEVESERLIGWVQLAVVVSFALLFVVAPRPQDAPTRMLAEPVPIALGVYAAFTLARLAIAYRWRIPGGLLVLSILADIALLIALIWAFHEQYGQGAPFSLKVPTFVYIFVFISLRALRFDPRYVLTAGIAAAIGWGLLVVAVLSKGGREVITRNFVSYINDNKVLLGAEFDKIFTILLVTVVLTFAVYRARELFVTAIRDEEALRTLSRFVGRGVSDAVVDSENELSAGMAEERDAAVIMLDIRGFTGMTNRVPPRKVVELLTALHARIVPIVRDHGGIVDKFLGDGIMATFGAAKPSETAAADALRALEAVMDAAREWEAELPAYGLTRPLTVNGAAVCGQVVFAVLGAVDRLEYTVIGETVNLAAKLEKHNKVEQTRALTTVETYERALAQGYVTDTVVVRPACDVGGTDRQYDLVVLA